MIIQLLRRKEVMVDYTFFHFIMNLKQYPLSLLSGCTSTDYGQDCLQKCGCVIPHTQDCNDSTGACTCITGWEGTNCELDINECKVNESYCPGPHEICRNLNGSAECKCNKGYQRFDPSEECQGKYLDRICTFLPLFPTFFFFFLDVSHFVAWEQLWTPHWK